MYHSNVETCSRGNNRNFSLVKHVAPGTRILWKGIALCCSNAVHCTLNLIKRILCFLRLIHVVHALNKFAAFVLMINTVPFVHSRLQNVFYAVSRERERDAAQCIIIRRWIRLLFETGKYWFFRNLSLNSQRHDKSSFAFYRFIIVFTIYFFFSWKRAKELWNKLEMCCEKFEN